VVEVDETFIGHDKNIKPIGEKRGRGFHHKNKVLSLVDRNSGQARSFVIDDVKATTVGHIVYENLAREAKLMTDEAAYYIPVGRIFASHNIVRAICTRNTSARPIPLSIPTPSRVSSRYSSAA
jgi:ISXO2 transposase-like protein